MSTVAPYGTWASPITPELVARSPQFLGVWSRQLDFDGDRLYGLEARPALGRSVIADYTADEPGAPASPDDFDARTTIYEYGGRCFCVADGAFVSSRYPDQRLYTFTKGAPARPITEPGAYRYGDLIWDRARGRGICVREYHPPEGEARHVLAAVSAAIGGHGQVLFDDADFVAWPALSPDGQYLAWVAWSHPNLPWTATALYRAKVEADGSLSEVTCLIPETDEVIMEPVWSPAGELYFLSDRSDWWNIYRWTDGGPVNVLPQAWEFGKAFWAVGGKHFDFRTESEIVALYYAEGIWRLGRIDLRSGSLTEIPTPFSFITRLAVRGDDCYMAATSPEQPIAIVHCDLATGALRVVHASARNPVPDGYLSAGQHIAFPSARGRTSYGNLYLPVNRDHVAPDGTKPPLLIHSHGGPTGMAQRGYNLGVQYWTSRGYAVFEVNYGGSTGYGRAYRHLLRGGWGVVDVEDHVAAARHLVAEGLVDPRAIAVRGWSAGGYATLACLAFSDVFAAGADHYGISDVEQFRRETHKLESRYADYLVGPEEDKALADARSPLKAAHRITSPLIIFQGLEDKIVPPNQSSLIAEELARRGVKVIYKTFPGEAHGFRLPATNEATFRDEEAFYADVLLSRLG